MSDQVKKRKGLSPSKQVALAWLVIAVLLLASARFAISDPRSGDDLHFTLPGIEHVGLYTCPFRTLTGLPCPICGITRSSAVIMRGDLAGSFRIHPLGPVLILGLVHMVPVWVWILFRKDDDAGPVSTKAFTIALIALVLLSWAINLVRHFKFIEW